MRVRSPSQLDRPGPDLFDDRVKPLQRSFGLPGRGRRRDPEPPLAKPSFVTVEDILARLLATQSDHCSSLACPAQRITSQRKARIAAQNLQGGIVLRSGEGSGGKVYRTFSHGPAST